MPSPCWRRSASSPAWSGCPLPRCRSIACSARSPASAARPQRAPRAPDASARPRPSPCASTPTSTPDLPWSFEPVQREVKVRARRERDWRSTARRNLSRRPMTGTATFNVTPDQGRPVFRQAAVLLLHRAAPEAGRERRHAGQLLRRSGDPATIRTRRTSQHDHAVLHLLPRRRRAARPPTPAAPPRRHATVN